MICASTDGTPISQWRLKDDEIVPRQTPMLPIVDPRLKQETVGGYDARHGPFVRSREGTFVVQSSL